MVGYVHATDSDEGVNAMVSYSIPTHLPFVIDNSTGMISTNTKLDYEHTKVNICIFMCSKFPASSRCDLLKRDGSV